MKLKDMTLLEAYKAGKLDKWITTKYGSWHNYVNIKLKEALHR